MNNQGTLSIVENNGSTFYLTFKLGTETFAANVSRVINILELSEITKIPMASSLLKGFIKLGGNTLPVIDLRLKFRMEEATFTVSTCILVLVVKIDDHLIHLGVLVDSVQEVLKIEKKEIHPSPSIGSSYNSEAIVGVVESNDNFIMVLDVEKIFNPREVSELKEKQIQSEKLTEKVEQ